jgi:hypothetical protein
MDFYAYFLYAQNKMASYQAICGISEDVVRQIHMYWSAYNAVYRKLEDAMDEFFDADVHESNKMFRDVAFLRAKLKEMQKSYIRFLWDNDVDYWDNTNLQEIQDLIHGVGLRWTNPDIDEELEYMGSTEMA